jgi:hypothetical protein
MAMTSAGKAKARVSGGLLRSYFDPVFGSDLSMAGSNN